MSQIYKNKYLLLHLHEISRLGKFIETENSGYQGLEKNRELEFVFGMMKKVLEIDSGNGCITLWMKLMPLNCILKNDQNGKFYGTYILPNFKSWHN